MAIDWALVVTLVLTSIVAAVGGIYGLALLQFRQSRDRGRIFADREGGTSFLFDGDVLLDATPEGRTLLTVGNASGTPWLRLLSWLGPRFADFENQMARLAQEGRITLTSDGPAGRQLLLQAELRGGLTRITILDPEEQTNNPAGDAVTRRATEDELLAMRATLAQAPILIWREGATGDVIWANATYLARLAEQPEGLPIGWPLPRLFDRIADPGQHRQPLKTAGRPDAWYDITQTADGTDQIIYAIPADTVVRAENALREFTQTLTKAFANLPIGLAIFDRQRQLQLFNPALLDLTGLGPDFLLMRPTLFAVLDGLRERHMIPEPKDYSSWRRQMTELEKAASAGLFEDTWSLPSGQTYRVTGHPHPNGAMALMIEDISSEVSSIRRYRADLELSQAVVDAVDQALAVFSPAGHLVMTNAAYIGLWGHDPATSLTDASVAALAVHWRAAAAVTPLWAEAAGFIADPVGRHPLVGEVRFNDGRLVECHFSALPGGSTLARFRIIGAAAPASLPRADRRSA